MPKSDKIDIATVKLPRRPEDKQCPYCGTYSYAASPYNCKDEEEARKCAWNVKAWNKPARKIGKIEGPAAND